MTWVTCSMSRPRAATSVATRDRKSTRLNSSHANISYAVFCLKKKRIGEHELHHHDAAGHPRQLQRRDLDRRDDGVRHRQAPDYDPLRHTLEPTHSDEFVRKHL